VEAHADTVPDAGAGTDPPNGADAVEERRDARARVLRQRRRRRRFIYGFSAVGSLAMLALGLLSLYLRSAT
jgi:hypothetical protein